jgi:hypothetical protein
LEHGPTALAGLGHCFFGSLEVVVDSRVPPLLDSVVTLDFPVDFLSLRDAFFVGAGWADGAGAADEEGASTL